MAESRSVLDPEVIKRCEEIGCADIVVGIPSFRNADTIAHVVRTAAQGMVEYFPGFYSLSCFVYRYIYSVLLIPT